MPECTIALAGVDGVGTATTKQYPELRTAWIGANPVSLTQNTRHLYDISNDTLSSETLSAIGAMCGNARVEAMDAVGSFTAPLRVFSAVQKATGVKRLNMVERDGQQLMHVERLVKGYNSDTSDPSYRVDAEIEAEFMRIRRDSVDAYGALSFEEGNSKWYEVAKPGLEAGTEVLLHNTDLASYVRNLDDSRPSVRFMYLSNALYLPVKIDDSVVMPDVSEWIPVLGSQRLLHTILSKEAIREGSMFLMFPSIHSAVLFRKGEDGFEPLELPVDDARYSLKRMGMSSVDACAKDARGGQLLTALSEFGVVWGVELESGLCSIV